MTEKEIKIEIPYGYEIDTENSNLEGGIIKFRPKKRFIDDAHNWMDGYTILSNGNIEACRTLLNWNAAFNHFPTVAEAKAASAASKISYIIKNDKRFGGVIRNDEWATGLLKYIIVRRGNKILPTKTDHLFCLLAFHTEDQRDLFLEENRQLVLDYFLFNDADRQIF